MKTPAPGECRNLSFHLKPIKSFNCRGNLRKPSKKVLKDVILKVNKKILCFSHPDFI